MERNLQNVWGEKIFTFLLWGSKKCLERMDVGYSCIVFKVMFNNPQINLFIRAIQSMLQWDLYPKLQTGI